MHISLNLPLNVLSALLSSLFRPQSFLWPRYYPRATPHSNINSRTSCALMSFVRTAPKTARPSIRRKHARRRVWITYFRVTWLDYLCLVVVASLTLGAYCTPMFSKDHRVVSLVPSINLSNKDQPFQEFQVPMDISHPWVKEPISTFGCALVVVFVPFLVIGIFQIKTRSLWDLHAGVMGVFKALVSTYISICSLSQYFRGRV